MATQHNIPLENFSVMRNFVDLNRFRPREQPLPERPRRALVFVGGFSGEAAMQTAREACAAEGVETVDFAGYSVGNPLPNPHEVLPGYDLVFATGRSAMEAIACGCAVVMMDAVRVSEFISPENYEGWRDTNFSIALTLPPMSGDAIRAAVAAYSAPAAREATKRLRAEMGLHLAVDQLIAIYEKVLNAHQTTATSAEEELRAACHYLRSLNGLVQRCEGLRPRAQLEDALALEREKRRQAQAKASMLQKKLDAVREAFDQSSVLRGMTRSIRQQWREMDDEPAE
jgi:hypothetical protein